MRTHGPEKREAGGRASAREDAVLPRAIKEKVQSLGSCMFEGDSNKLLNEVNSAKGLLIYRSQ